MCEWVIAMIATATQASSAARALMMFDTSLIADAERLLLPRSLLCCWRPLLRQLESYMPDELRLLRCAEETTAKEAALHQAAQQSAEKVEALAAAAAAQAAKEDALGRLAAADGARKAAVRRIAVLQEHNTALLAMVRTGQVWLLALAPARLPNSGQSQLHPQSQGQCCSAFPTLPAAMLVST